MKQEVNRNLGSEDRLRRLVAAVVVLGLRGRRARAAVPARRRHRTVPGHLLRPVRLGHYRFTTSVTLCKNLGTA